MVNHMSEVAELLDVELNEVFQIDNYRSVAKEYFRLTEDGLEQSDTVSGKEWEAGEDWILVVLLTGEADIIQMPWRPKKGELYYVPRIPIIQKYAYDIHCWEDKECDIKYYRMGLVCKTPAEALGVVQKMLAVAKKRD